MTRANNMPSPERRRKRWVLMWAQGCVCPACGGMLDPDANPEGQDAPTLDHVETRGRGGANTLANLLVKHRRCNEIRGDKFAGERDAEALRLVGLRLQARPLLVSDCEALAREIYAIHRASRQHQPNAHRERVMRSRLTVGA